MSQTTASSRITLSPLQQAFHDAMCHTDHTAIQESLYCSLQILTRYPLADWPDLIVDPIVRTSAEHANPAAFLASLASRFASAAADAATR